MDIRQLTQFVQIYEDGNLTKSARQLNISQQGLSMSIIRLEEEIGRKLFVRTPAGVTPTQDGEFFYQRATAILEELARCEDYFSRDMLGREITVALTHGVLDWGPPDFQNSLLNLNPEFRISKTLSGSVRTDYLMENENYDLGFSINPVDERKFHVHPLYESAIVLMANRRHPLARFDRVGLDKLGGLNIAMPHESYKTTQRFLKSCKQAGVHPKGIGGTTGTIQSVNWLRSNPDALVLTVELFVSFVNDPDITVIHIDGDDFSWVPHMIYRVDRKMSQVAKKYVQFVLRCFE